MISSTLRPPTPPVALTCCTAASSEFLVMTPTNDPIPETGETTPILMVSLAPFRVLDPLEQAARRLAPAARPRPPTIPQRRTCRRVGSPLRGEEVLSHWFARPSGSLTS